MAFQRGKEVHFWGHKLYNEFISRSSANFVLPPLFFPVAWNHGERTYFKKYNIFDWHHEGSARARKMGWHISLFSFLRPTLLKAVWAHILIPSFTRHRRGNVNEGDLFSLAALCPSLLWHFQVFIKKKHTEVLYCDLQSLDCYQGIQSLNQNKLLWMSCSTHVWPFNVS